MGDVLGIWEWIKNNGEQIVSIVAHLCLAGSIIVKLTPTLKDDNYFKAIVKFIGKYIALDKYGPTPNA